MFVCVFFHFIVPVEAWAYISVVVFLHFFSRRIPESEEKNAPNNN